MGGTVAGVVVMAIIIIVLLYYARRYYDSKRPDGAPVEVRRKLMR